MRGSSLIENTANASTVYLPQFPNEPTAVYNLRVRRSYLTNYFLRAIDSDSGKVLAKSIGIKVNGDQDAPEQFDPWLDDTDLEGKPFSVMARDQLQDALGKGISLAYVDYIGARPFVREIDVDNVLSFRADQATGKLTFLRWQDSIPEDSEDEGLINSDVVFEITPTEWRMFRLDDENQDIPADQGDIVRFRAGSQRIDDELPVSLFYTNKAGKLLGESPYRTLAELTLEHFQVYSDMKNMLFYALQPILLGINLPDDFALSSLASYLFIKMPRDQYEANFKWIQVDAGPIEQARAQLEDIERNCAICLAVNMGHKNGPQVLWNC
jgi:hypothetical protein